MVQYVKDRTEAFDDLFPDAERRLRSGRTFERVLNPLSAFTSMQDFVLENKDLGRSCSGGGRRICLVAERHVPGPLARIGGGLNEIQPLECPW